MQHAFIELAHRKSNCRIKMCMTKAKVLLIKKNITDISFYETNITTNLGHY